MTLVITALILCFAVCFLQFFCKDNGKVRYYIMCLSIFATAVLTSVPSFKAVRSLNSDYINFAFSRINFTFVLDSVTAPILLFLLPVIFLILLNGSKSIVNNGGKYSMIIGLFVCSIIALLTSVNAILFIAYLEIMIISTLLLFKAEKKDIFISQCGILILSVALVWLFLSTGTIEFGRLVGMINPVSFVLILSGLLISAYSLNRVRIKSDDILADLLVLSVALPALIYCLLRFLFLWKIPEEFISYIILVTGFLIAFRGVKDALRCDNTKSAAAALSYKNTGLILISMAVSMFGMILNNLPACAIGMFGVYFLTFNQIAGVSALIIASDNSYEYEETSGWSKFLPADSLYFAILLFVLLAVPPLTGFTGEVLLYNSVISGLEIKNHILIAFLLISLAFLAVLEVYTLSAAAKLIKETVIMGKSYKRMLLLSGHIIILLFAAFFPQIAIEFFIAAVFVFTGGNLLVPQIILSNISLINLSFLAMFLAIILLRYLLVKENK